MDKKSGKTVLVSVATILILSLLVFFVFRNDYREIIDNIRAVSVPSLCLLLAAGTSFQMFDAAVCYVLIRGRLPEFTFRQAIGVVYLGVFGNTSTFSVGSVPLQSGYLHCCGLPVGVGVGVMMVEYVLHKSSVVIYATVMLLLRGGSLMATRSDLLGYVIWSYAVCVLIIAALILLCTSERVMKLALRLLARLPNNEKHNRRREAWNVNITAMYTQSREILKSPALILEAAALNAAKLMCFFAIPFLTARVLKISALSFWQVQLLAALMYLISNALPNIAGMGSVEFAFMLIFSPYMVYTEVSSALILYRVATFFFPFVISIFIFLLAQRRIMSGGAHGAK